MQSRSQEKELMDGPLSDPEVLFRNLDEIALINKFTALYSIQLRQINKLIPKGQKELEIVDLGCGGGDFLNFLLKNKKQLPEQVRLTGLDSEVYAIEHAKKTFPDLKTEVSWLQKDYRDWLLSDEKTDIICCNLFCHHLSDGEITDLLIKGSEKARLGLIINDLHRHPIPFYFIKIMTQLFSGSEYTKNDAPLSVKRSFTGKDWKTYIRSATTADNSINWRIKWLPTFRFLIIGQKNN